MGLYDMVMLKDNHIDFAGGIPEAVARTKAYLAKNNRALAIEVETRNLTEVKAALEANVDRIMLDNFSISETKEAVAFIAGRTAELALLVEIGAHGFVIPSHGIEEVPAIDGQVQTVVHKPLFESTAHKIERTAYALRHDAFTAVIPHDL